MGMTAEQVRAVLAAYQQVVVASWPNLHPDMAANAKAWSTARPEALERELQDYLRAAANATSPVRVFWKLLPAYTFGGCNDGFARDAGLTVADMIGHDDFDKRLPWVHQAAKYRADDEAVVKSGQARLDIVERQREASGQITWVRVGKTPIRAATGVIGVLGAYEVLDAKTGHKLFAEKSRGPKKKP